MISMFRKDEVRKGSMIDRSEDNSRQNHQGGDPLQARRDRSLVRSSTWKPQPMEQYRHFKGGRYQVLCVAEKEDTGEKLVIYQALYGVGKIWARSLRDFASEVDHARYPEARQKFRFEKIDPLGDAAAADREERYSGQAQHSSYAGKQTGPSDTGRNMDLAAHEHENVIPASGRQEPGEIGTPLQDNGNISGAIDQTDEENARPGSGEDGVLNPLVEQFLDADSAEEKLAVLSKMRSIVTDDMIDTMAMASGVEIDPGPVETRYYDLRDCLMMIDRYELERGRLRN